MNRRDFLKGVAGIAAVAAVPAIAIEPNKAGQRLNTWYNQDPMPGLGTEYEWGEFIPVIDDKNAGRGTYTRAGNVVTVRAKVKASQPCVLVRGLPFTDSGLNTQVHRIVGDDGYINLQYRAS